MGACLTTCCTGCCSCVDCGTGDWEVSRGPLRGLHETFRILQTENKEDWEYKSYMEFIDEWVREGKFVHPFPPNTGAAYLPKLIRKIPKSELFALDRIKELFGQVFKNGVVYPLVTSINTRKFDDLDDYTKFLKVDKFISKLLGGNTSTPFHGKMRVQNWRTDECWGRQFVAGINPIVIQRVDLAKAFAKMHLDADKEATINAVLEAHRSSDGVEYPLAAAVRSLAGLADAGRLLMADYWLLEDTFRKGFFVDRGTVHDETVVQYAPQALFCVTDDGEVMPIAIRLGTKLFEGEKLAPLDCEGDNRIFVPRDHASWLYAKMLVSHADGVTHQALSHLAYTHLVIEPFVIAFNRSAPYDLKRLMQGHFEGTLMINSLGRPILAYPGGVFDELASLGCENFYSLAASAFEHDFNYDKMDPSVLLSENGFKEDDASRYNENFQQVDSFLYRRQALAMWDALHEYFVGCVGKLWPHLTDEEIELEMGALNREMLGATVRGFRPVQSRADLVELCTRIAFNASVQHGAVNFGQYAAYAFTPNHPLIIFGQGMPEDPETVTERSICHSLPQTREVIETLILLHILTLPPDNDLWGGGPPAKEMAELEIPACYKDEFVALMARFKTLDKIFEDQNKELDWEFWDYMQPSHCPASISV